MRSKTIDLYLEGVSELLGGYWRHAVTARRYHGLNFKGVIPLERKFVYDNKETIIISSDSKSVDFGLNRFRRSKNLWLRQRRKIVDMYRYCGQKS